MIDAARYDESAVLATVRAEARLQPDHRVTAACVASALVLLALATGFSTDVPAWAAPWALAASAPFLLGARRGRGAALALATAALIASPAAIVGVAAGAAAGEASVRGARPATAAAAAVAAALAAVAVLALAW